MSAPPLVTVPFTTGGAKLRGLRLPSRGPESEQGREVLHLHGLGCHGAASWAPFAALRGQAALIPDLPGHGRSDAPQDFGYTLPEMTDAISALLHAEGGGPREVLGHSLGGTIAVHLAARHPGLVQRLLLVEPALDVPIPGPEDITLVPEEELEHGGFGKILAREVEWRRAEVRLTAPHALVRSARSLLDEHAAATNELLEHLPQPVLLVTGEQRTYARQGRFDAAGIRAVRVPGAAHFVMHDAPDSLLTALEDPAP